MKFLPKLSVTEKKPQHKEFLKSFKEILTNKQIDLLMIIAMMKSLVTNSSCILLPFLWKSMEYTPFYIGFALFLFVFDEEFVCAGFDIELVVSEPISWLDDSTISEDTESSTGDISETTEETSNEEIGSDEFDGAFEQPIRTQAIRKIGINSLIITFKSPFCLNYSRI